jgi:hypothetical protein
MAKQTILVLEVLDDGPAHCHDVASELGMPMRTASAVLSELYALGLLTRKYKVRPHFAANECWVYEKAPNVKSTANLQGFADGLLHNLGVAS